MSVLPSPEELTAERDAALAAAPGNAQGEAATPAAEPGGPAAKQPDATAVPQVLPKFRKGGQTPLPALSANDELLYGQTMRPGEAGHVGSDILSRRTLPPENLGKYVPALNAAIQDPEAPALLHNLATLLAHHLGA